MQMYDVCTRRCSATASQLTSTNLSCPSSTTPWTTPWKNSACVLSPPCRPRLRPFHKTVSPFTGGNVHETCSGRYVSQYQASICATEGRSGSGTLTGLPEMACWPAAPSASRASALELAASIGGDTVSGTGSGGGTKTPYEECLPVPLKGSNETALEVVALCTAITDAPCSEAMPVCASATGTGGGTGNGPLGFLAAGSMDAASGAGGGGSGSAGNAVHPSSTCSNTDDLFERQLLCPWPVCPQ